MGGLEILAWIGIPVFLALCGFAAGGIKLIVTMTAYFTKSREAQESTAKSNQGIREDLAKLGQNVEARFNANEDKLANHGERLVVLEDFKQRTERK